jgi:hypothetical protein
MPAVTLEPHILRTVADPGFIGLAIRRAAEQALRRKLLRHCCAVVSCAFSIVLDAFSVPHKMVVGHFQDQDHVWVESAGRIYDLTLTQFDPLAAPVSILPVDDQRYNKLYTTSKEVARLQLEVFGTAHLVLKIVQQIHIILAEQLVTSGSVRGTERKGEQCSQQPA